MLRIIIFLLIVIGQDAFSQEVLWASKVLEKSSETADDNYSPKHQAVQILGRPNVLPQTISSPCAWRPTGSNFGEDYIKVGFEKGTKVKQIAIAENVNPGAIGRIFGYNSKNEEFLLYQNGEDEPKSSGRLWNISIPETDFEVVALKILVVHSIKKGFKEYDAIGISGSDSPIRAAINVAEKIPEKLEKENLGTNVNSKFGEVAPIVAPDGKTLFFTRLNHPNNITEKTGKQDKNAEIAQDIWFSKLSKNGTWEPAENIGQPINNSSNNAAATISADGKSLFVLNVYLPNGKFIAGLSRSTRRANKWNMPEQIIIEDFQALDVYDERLRIKKTDTEYAISSDESILIMGLRRMQSFGDKDLYVSFKKPDGSYSKPQNLGPDVNSAASEGSPFLAADNKTLYFNSKGHSGYGDADIFVSTRLDDTWKNWTTPVNLGPQINSPQWDGYITIPASGEFAYLSSSKNSIGGEDIFRVKLFPSIKPEPLAMLNFQFADMMGGTALQPKVSLISSDPKADSLVWSYDEDLHEYKSILKLGEKYTIKASLAGYMDVLEVVDLSKEKVYMEIKKTFNMMPLKTGQKMILQNLFFDQGKFEIREDSYAELTRIIGFMQENPSIEILLEGHTDNQGDIMLNIKLAENRVKAVKAYLVEKGEIAENRISIKSWGPTRPLNSNSTDESRKKNRRVEFTITKM
jgi:outer membrane protein OmpA-like peptidoglycan-associated protein